MITVNRLVDIFPMMNTFQIYSLSSFQIYNTVLLTIVTILYITTHYLFYKASRVAKNLLANAGDIRDMGFIPGSGRSPGEGHGNPLQDSCLENPMDREAWWAIVHSVAQSQTPLKRLSMHACTYFMTGSFYLHTTGNHHSALCISVWAGFLRFHI